MSSVAVGAGSVLSGRYRLVEHLASGGMGTVWRAQDLLLDRPVAVKEVRLPPGLDEASRDLLRRRTIREAQVAARLRHPAIVTIFDVVEQDGRPWIVMELVPSRSLAQIIRTNGPLPPARVAAIGLRVLDAMVAAAAAGVEHRDIKPANVLVTDDGRVVLTDFGIARHVGDETLTSAGLIVGSPDYLAPERARGQDSGLPADLWSLGATMYDAVEGRRPFERNGPLPTLAAVVMDEPDRPVHAGPLRPVIDRLLVKDPAHRLDADQTRAMLQRVLRGRPVAGTMPLPRRTPGDARPAIPPRRGAPTAPDTGPTAPLRTGPPSGAAGAPPRTDGARTRGPATAAPPAAVAGAPGAAGAVGAPGAAGAVGAGAVGAAAAGVAAAAAASHSAATDRAPTGTAPTGTAPTGTAPTGTAPNGGAAVEGAVQSPADRAPAGAAAEGLRADGSATAERAGTPARGTQRLETSDSGVRAGAGAAGLAGAALAGVAAADRTAVEPGAAADRAAVEPGETAVERGETAVQRADTADRTAVEPGETAVEPGDTVRERRTAPAPAGPGPAGSGPGRGGGAGRTPGGGRGAAPGRRRALLAGLVVLVLAGIAAVLVPTFRSGQDPRANGPAATGAAGSGAAAGGPAGGPAASGQGNQPTGTTRSSAPSQSSGQGNGGSGGNGGNAGTGAAPTRAPGANPGTPATGARVVAPAGFIRYTDPTDGFSLVLPAGWQPVRHDTRVDFEDPGSSRFLRIDTSSHPLPDPYQNWIDYERQFSQGKVDYHNLGIRRVPDYRPEEGWSTADWEFTLGGTHVLDRNIRVSNVRAHAIYWSTPQSQWDTAESRRILQLAEQSFVPAPPDS